MFLRQGQTSDYHAVSFPRRRRIIKVAEFLLESANAIVSLRERRSRAAAPEPARRRTGPGARARPQGPIRRAVGSETPERNVPPAERGRGFGLQAYVSVSARKQTRLRSASPGCNQHPDHPRHRLTGLRLAEEAAASAPRLPPSLPPSLFFSFSFLVGKEAVRPGSCIKGSGFPFIRGGLASGSACESHEVRRCFLLFFFSPACTSLHKPSLSLTHFPLLFD